jgi:hypothetical protein
MKDFFTERKTSVEGFYTNIAFPGSQAATRSNTPSDAVYTSRKMLEQDNKLDEKVDKLNKVGENIQKQVAGYKSKSSRLLAQIKTDSSDQDKLKLSNILINKLYTTPELNERVRVIALGSESTQDEKQRQQDLENGIPGNPEVYWAFKRLYTEIPDTEQYQVAGGLTTNYYGQQSKLKYMVKNQGKKLTFDECKELAAQQGSLVFGLTNTEVVNNVYRSTCLLPSMEDVMGGNMSKYSTVKSNPRIVMLTDVGSQKLSISVRDGSIGVTPIYKVVPKVATTVNSENYYNETSMSPAFTQINMARIEYDWKDVSTRSEYGVEEVSLYESDASIFRAAAIAKSKGVKYLFCRSGWNAKNIQDVVDWNRKWRDPKWTGQDLTLPVKGLMSGSYSAPYFYGLTGARIEEYVKNLKQKSRGSGNFYRCQYAKDDAFGKQLENRIVRLPYTEEGTTSEWSQTVGVWKLGEDNSDSSDGSDSSLTEDGYFNVENVVPQTYLSSMNMPVADWKSIQENKENSSVFNSWISKTLQEAKTKNVPYVGFFYKYQTETDGELIAFGTPTKGVETNSTYTVTDDKGIKYGDANTITYYMLAEKGSDNVYGFSRFGDLLGNVSYIDKKQFLRTYSKSMLTPKDASKTQYEIVDNTKSDYFNMENVPLSELQTLGMTIPACRELCNKYYDTCKAFVYEADAQSVGLKGVRDGTIVPKCSLKTIDPTIYSWGTENSDYSRMYKKIPQINNNWTCTKRVNASAASYVLAGQKQLFGSGNYVGLDGAGNEITEIKRGVPMSEDEKCGTWRQYEQDAAAMRKMQESIGLQVEEYVTLLGELKTYNKDLLERAHINKPMVDASVEQYKEIVDQINTYADSGEFRIDKYKTQMSDISRKSDIYIYILWLAIASIVVFFAVRAIMKLKQQ